MVIEFEVDCRLFNHNKLVQHFFKFYFPGGPENK
jgi:hypothetical protein